MKQFDPIEIQKSIETRMVQLNFISPTDANFVFFWKPHTKVKGTIDEACCSQWWFSNFTFRGQRFPTAEHAMMFNKAKMFGDSDAMSAILQERHPHAVKAIGRQVKNFDDKRWTQERYDLVRAINNAKFKQDRRLKEWLLSHPENTVFVEASPFDRIWGIGLEATAQFNLNDVGSWQGLNELGFAITDVLQAMHAEARRERIQEFADGKRA